MKKGSLENLPPIVQLFLLVAIFGVAMILITLLTFISLLMIVGIDETMSLFSESLGFLRFSQIIQSIMIFIVPALFAAYLFSKKPMNLLGFNNPKIPLFLLALAMFFIAQPMISWLANINNNISLPEFLNSFEYKMRAMENDNNNLVFRFLDTSQPSVILINIFMIVIIPAFGEELFFRGSIQPLFGKMFNNRHLAVWVTAFIFAAIHLQFFTFLPRFILGALLGYLFLYGKNIWYSITGHLINNLISISVFYYYRHYHPDVNPMNPNTDDFGWLMITASIVLITVLFYFFYKIAKAKNSISNLNVCPQNQLIN
jgi:membrane protease YdiL (CAAX protease family)